MVIWTPGHLPAVIAVESGGGDHRHPPEGKYPPPQCPTWVTCREGNGDDNPGAENGTVVGECVPGPPVHGLSRPAEGLRPCGLWMPTDNSGGIWCGPPHVQATVKKLGTEIGHHPPKRLTWPAIKSN